MRSLIVLATLMMLSACSTLHAPADCGGDFHPVNALDEQSAVTRAPPVRC